ncbi:F-box only protein 6-like [Acanthaster planci]|uniref:F-box only protein 6-like n=1 Tax=Acanthaster planci TaxID=133434 RepID=A0A8B7ZGW4_ACAPL|nr:F-box only protein 6-like [Acanthaster planci]
MGAAMVHGKTGPGTGSDEQGKEDHGWEDQDSWEEAGMDDIDMAVDSNESLQMTLEVMPVELLTEILSFVPPKWLLNCALVCRAWRDVVQSQGLWRKMCQRTGRFIEKYMAPHYPEDWREFYFKCPYTRNLIKNPSGKDGLNAGWIITGNGGDGWLVETERAGSESKPDELRAISDGSPHHFATSYGWCIRHQLIDLVAEGCSEAMLDKAQPDIFVSEWFAARFDCGSVYELTVQLQRDESGNKDRIIDKFTFGPYTTPQWGPSYWKEASHVFSGYGPGLRFIHYEDRSKDTQFWAGHYGSKMAGSVVRLQFNRK